jgi:hypothetical protein
MHTILHFSACTPQHPLPGDVSEMVDDDRAVSPIERVNWWRSQARGELGALQPR